MANLARIRGDFPIALVAVPGLGWKGRHYRVLGDVHWPHADFDNAITAFEHARAEAEHHGAAGERAIAQTRLALATAFADPERADDELALAHQLLEPLDQRATTLLAQVAGLIRDAGTDHDVTGRATLLRTHIDVAGLAWLTPLLETALAFHHAVQAAHDDLTTAIGRLREATSTGDYAYYADIAHFMAARPLPMPSTTTWLDTADAVRNRWHNLVTARQHHLNRPTSG
ncbi:hypothetical protein ACWD5R_33195 [Streptomyces sp. NPDC002514]|uniref:hypothetical protein n=1 Tax=Streptomyces sp. NPDC001270 TaxID=3364554 RepID=UPI0036CDCDC2